VVFVLVSFKFQSKCKASNNIRLSCVRSHLILIFSWRHLYCRRCCSTHVSSGGLECRCISNDPVLTRCAWSMRKKECQDSSLHLMVVVSSLVEVFVLSMLLLLLLLSVLLLSVVLLFAVLSS